MVRGAPLGTPRLVACRSGSWPATHPAVLEWPSPHCLLPPQATKHSGAIDATALDAARIQASGLEDGAEVQRPVFVAHLLSPCSGNVVKPQCNTSPSNESAGSSRTGSSISLATPPIALKALGNKVGSVHKESELIQAPAVQPAQPEQPRTSTTAAAVTVAAVSSPEVLLRPLGVRATTEPGIAAAPTLRRPIAVKARKAYVDTSLALQEPVELLMPAAGAAVALSLLVALRPLDENPSAFRSPILPHRSKLDAACGLFEPGPVFVRPAHKRVPL